MNRSTLYWAIYNICQYLDVINFLPFQLNVAYSSHATFYLPSDGELCLNDISSGVLLKLVMTAWSRKTFSTYPSPEDN